MRKLLTLLLAVCMVATICALPAGAASFELVDIRCDNVLGTATVNYTFDQEEGGFTAGNNRVINYNGALNVSKDATDSAESIDINAGLTLAGNLNLVTFRLKVDQETGTTTSVLFGNGTQKAKAAFWIDFVPGSIGVQNQERVDENGVWKSVSGLTLDEYVEAKVLIDSKNRKCYVWIGENVDIFNTEPIVDGFDFYSNNTSVKTIRIWRANNKTAATLYLDNLMVTPLVEVPFMPVVGAEGYAYEETFPSTYGAYSEDAEPWKTFKDTVLAPRDADANAASCNAAELVVNENGELVITQVAKNGTTTYHNWYFTKDETYKSKEPETNQLVIQVDVKSDDVLSIHLGSYSANAVRVRVTDDGTSLKARYNAEEDLVATSYPSFVHAEGLDTAAYTTLTFLLEEGHYSLWMNSEKVIDRKTNNKDAKVDSISFLTKNNGQQVYVDNIRVFEAPDFINVDNFMRSVTGMSDFMTTDSDGIVSFGSSTLDTSNVTVQYEDSKGYYDGSNIAYPLFGDKADVRAVISSNGKYTQVVAANNVAFPSGYTTIGAATVDGRTVSIPVTLRNAASARTDELLVLAAAYDSTGALVESKACTLVGDAFVADFDTDISGCTVRGFVWQNGTLRPVR